MNLKNIVLEKITEEEFCKPWGYWYPTPFCKHFNEDFARITKTMAYGNYDEIFDDFLENPLGTHFGYMALIGEPAFVEKKFLEIPGWREITINNVRRRAYGREELKLKFALGGENTHIKTIVYDQKIILYSVLARPSMISEFDLEGFEEINNAIRALWVPNDYMK